MAQPRRMLARGILGNGRTHGVSFRPFPNSSGWLRLISSVFLIRISCHKTTHANVTMVPGQGGRFLSVCFLLTSSLLLLNALCVRIKRDTDVDLVERGTLLIEII